MRYRKAFVTLPSGVWRIIDELKGPLGDNDSEVIRNIVLAHLSDRGVLIPSYSAEGTPSILLKEIQIQNKFLETLVALLSERENLRTTKKKP